MATTHVHREGDVPVDVLDGAVKEYPKDKLYLINFAVLFAITVAEVLTYFLTDFPLFKAPFLVPTLLILGAIKFFLVAYIFMHLRFDKKVLSVIFYSGLVLAIAVYIAILTVFRVWWPADHMICQSSPEFPKEAPVQAHTVCPPLRGR